jgi:hypothetical protein
VEARPGAGDNDQEALKGRGHTGYIAESSVPSQRGRWSILLARTRPNNWKHANIIFSLARFVILCLVRAMNIQELVKGTLEATIRLHSNKSTTVDYEIDGEIVEEWDA